MSFGFAVGDFVTIGKLAWRLYKSTKGAPASFYDIDKDLLSFHAVVQEAEETIFKSPLSQEKQDRLQVIGDGCKQILADLQAVVDKYESLGAKRKTLIWDRMRWGKEDITGIRARLSTNATLLGVFISTSQVSVEQKLDKYLEEFRQGRREGSIISNQSVDSLSTGERGLWRSIRGELEEVGIDLAAWENNHDYIKAWFKRAVEVGAFEERVPPETNYVIKLPAPSSRSISSPQLSERHEPRGQEYSDSHRPGGSPSRQPDSVTASSSVQSIQTMKTALSGQTEANSSQQMYPSLEYYQQLPDSTLPVHQPTQSHHEPFARKDFPAGTAKVDPSLALASLYAEQPDKDKRTKESAQERFRHSIHNLRQKTADGKYYINPQLLKRLCSREAIDGVIKEIPSLSDKREAIFKSIMKNGIAIWCILVYIKKEHLMTKFMKSDQNHHLPLEIINLESIAGEAAKEFFEYQWEFQPVVLAKNQYKQLDDQCVLPFLEYGHLRDLDGSVGETHEMIIDSSMQRLLGSKVFMAFMGLTSVDFDNPLANLKPMRKEPTITVIRKQIHSSPDRDKFSKERQYIVKLKATRHPNLKDLLCAYSYKDSHNLLFESEALNLNQFLQLEERYRGFKSNTTFYAALYGLASALDYLHKSGLPFSEIHGYIPGCRHEIRPQNIVVRDDTFLLANFVLGKSNNRIEDAYMAPESIINGSYSGPAGEIWSLGGIMLDIASYMEGGPQGLIASQHRRVGKDPYLHARTQFFSHRALKIEVVDTIENLQRDPGDKVLRTCMILSRNMLLGNPKARLSLRIVRQNLGYIAAKSLFRAVLNKMILCKTDFLGTRSEREFWAVAWKFWAWGEEIGINGANLAPKKFTCAVRTESEEKNLHDVLQRLLANRSRKPRAPTKPFRSGPSNLDIILGELISALPVDYRFRMSERTKNFDESYSEESLSRMPQMPDEDLQPSFQTFQTQSNAATPSQITPINRMAEAIKVFDGIGSNPHPLTELYARLASHQRSARHAYFCPKTDCAYVGAEAGDLGSHMRTHPELKIYQCTYSWCERKKLPFLSLVRLREHMRDQHVKEYFG